MGAKYTTQTVSGFNVLPPPDDGSTVANNLVTWAGARGVKTQIGDPLNTFAAAINSALLLALDFGGRAAAGSETCTAADHMRTIECPVAMTATLPTASVIGSGFTVGYVNTSGTTVTVNLQTGTDTLNGTAKGTMDLAGNAISVFKVNAAATGYYATNISLLAPLLSPAFTGIPTAPTAPAGTSTTQLATTAFVTATSFVSALPAQAGNSGKIITTDGVNASWSQQSGNIMYSDLNLGGF
jgi:hypothetical protein